MDKGNLKKHSESLHGGKTFKCEICLSSFTQNSSLRRHIKSVHGGKTLTCEICLSRFTQKKLFKKAY